MKFKLNDRVSWSIFNLTGTVTDVLSDIVYIKWDEGNNIISYNAFECRNMEVMSVELFKVGDRVTNNSRNKGVITRIDKYVMHPCFTTYFKWDDGNEILPTKIDQSTHSEIWIKWDDGNEPYLYTDILNFHLDTTPVLTTKEADTTPVFKVGDSVLSRDHKYSGVVTNVGFSNCIFIKWDHHDSELFYSNTSDINALILVLTTKEADTTPVFKVGDRVLDKSGNKGVIISNPRANLLVVKWDESFSYFYTNPQYLTLDNSIVATDNKSKITPEADTTPAFKVGDRVAHKKSINKGVIISNYRTTLLVVQWDTSSDYFYTSPEELKLDKELIDVELTVKQELLRIAKLMLTITARQEEYRHNRKLLVCIDALTALK
jgi:hypothetical protein